MSEHYGWPAHWMASSPDFPSALLPPAGREYRARCYSSGGQAYAGNFLSKRFVKPFRTILFPVDFSAAAAGMAPVVREMAERFGARVVLVHAFLPLLDYNLTPSETTCELERVAIPYTAAFQELRNRRQHQIEDFSSAHFAGVLHSEKIEDGDPASVIELIARDAHADLIAMPTRGLGRFRRLLLGSVTAKVLHDVDCPVLTTAHDPVLAAIPAGGYRSILCAVELNAEADAVLRAAGFLAQEYRASLCLLHIESASSPPREARASEAVERALKQAWDADGGKTGVEAKVCVLDGAVPQGIRQAAIEEKADLVVVGRGHERGELSRIWSHLYSIIRDSPCLVLSV